MATGVIPELREIVAFGRGYSVTRDAFWARVQHVVAALREREATRAAVITQSVSQFGAALFALAHTGVTAVIPAEPKPGSLEQCEAGYDVLITDDPAAFPGVPTIDPSAEAACTDALPLLDDARIDFHTSGSSGAPSSISESFGFLRRASGVFNEQWGDATRGLLHVGTVPHYHHYGAQFLCAFPLLSGHPTWDESAVNLATLRAVATASRCLLVTSPMFLSHMLDMRELPGIERIPMTVCSAAPLAEGDARRMAEVHGRAPIEIYGSTEAGMVAWRQWRAPAGSGTWKLMPHTEIDFRAEDAGVRLWVRNAATAGWSPSGDLARPDGQGSFELMGRVGNVMKVADRRVSLDAMQRVLCEHPAVADARLVILPGSTGRIGAAVILSDAGKQQLAGGQRKTIVLALRAYLMHRYADVLVPRKWRFVEAWPEHVTSKVPQSWLAGLFPAR